MEDKDCTPAVHGYVKPGTGKNSAPSPSADGPGPLRAAFFGGPCVPWGASARGPGGGAGKSRGRAPDIGTSMELMDAALLVKGGFYTYGNCK